MTSSEADKSAGIRNAWDDDEGLLSLLLAFGSGQRRCLGAQVPSASDGDNRGAVIQSLSCN